jgi:hypothetical protein
MSYVDVASLIAALSDSANAEDPRTFPRDKSAARNAGLYSWWADDAARRLLGTELGAELVPLIYAGQAGATKWPSGTPSAATLASRVGGQHIRGNARSSTFRLTISAVLMRPLDLIPGDRGRLTPASNKIVSEWIADHLTVATAPIIDRDTLSTIEAQVVHALDPPLNLDHCAPTAMRALLTKLRRQLPRG